jgi:hypothetical protein
MSAQTEDWAALEIEYVTGDYLTLREFAEAKGLSYDTVRTRSARDDPTWTEKKAQHLDRVNAALRADDVKEKVLSARQQREYTSAILAGIINQWRILNQRLAKWEAKIGDPDAPTKSDLESLRVHLRAMTRLIPEVGKYLEVLSGRPSSRVGGPLADLTDEELRRISEGEFDEGANGLQTEGQGEPREGKDEAGEQGTS